MNRRRFTRRDFMRLTATAAGASVLASCKQTTPAAVEPTEIKQVATEAKAAVATATEAVAAGPMEFKLEFLTQLPEYAAGYQQIWDLYLAENPHISFEMLTYTEGAAAEALDAKRAGGWFPSIDSRFLINQHNYQELLNLLETDFPWFDRWTYDVKTAWANTFRVDNYLPVISHSNNYILGWLYHQDLMEKAGLDPNQIKTWEDFEKFLDEGSKWAAADGEVDYFWERAGGGWVIIEALGAYSSAWEVGHPDRQKEAMMTLNLSGDDSPFRPALDFLVRAYENGWLPKEWWLREHEPDMEANFVAKKGALIHHGPWMWDKVLSADPTAQLDGFPSSPPSENGGPAKWIHMRDFPSIDGGMCMDKRVKDLSEYAEIQKAFNWWHSPEIVKLRCEVEGNEPAYKTDEPVELESPQYVKYTSEFAPGGRWADLEVLYFSPLQIWAPYARENGQLIWEWDWSDVTRKVMTKEMTQVEFLQWIEDQAALNFEIPGVS